MSDRGEIWGVVLAGGEGRRLAEVTGSEDGVPIPKQYCALVDDRTLLRATLDRTSRLIPRQRIVVVVAEQHRRFWHRELREWPAENLIVQPQNRGTAAGILLPLLEVAERDHSARVLVVPSDHHVENEGSWLASMAVSLVAVERARDRVVLLGIEPDRAETELGWIAPQGLSTAGPRGVARFVEKPTADEAERLAATGGLWNSFVFASRVETLLSLYLRRQPELLDRMVSTVLPARTPLDRSRAIARLYRRLEAQDFSRDLLAGSEDALLALTVPACGWTDLGTPDRLARVRRERAAVTPARRRVAASGNAVAPTAALAPSPA